MVFSDRARGLVDGAVVRVLALVLQAPQGAEASVCGGTAAGAQKEWAASLPWAQGTRGHLSSGFCGRRLRSTPASTHRTPPLGWLPVSPVPIGVPGNQPLLPGCALVCALPCRPICFSLCVQLVILYSSSRSRVRLCATECRGRCSRCPELEYRITHLS